jgi:hypothetical protein
MPVGKKSNRIVNSESSDSASVAVLDAPACDDMDEVRCQLCGTYTEDNIGFSPCSWLGISFWVCPRCCGSLVPESRAALRQQTTTLRPWRSYPECDRCEARVPGTIERVITWWPSGEPDSLHLCPQCCLTLYRQTHPHSRRWLMQANIDAQRRLEALAAQYQAEERQG